MKRQLYCIFSFSKEGYMRGFASGFDERNCKGILFDETLKGNICLLADDSKMSKIPSKFLEGNYWKRSQDDNDLKDIANLIL